MADTKKSGWLIDYDGSKFVPKTVMFDIFNRHGTYTFSQLDTNDDLGSSTKFVYIDDGIFKASAASVANDGVTLMYLNSGTLTPSTQTVGSATKPVWLSGGKITASNGNIATDEKTLMYLSNGELSESAETVGGSAQPIYLSNGTLTASNSTLGANDKFLYMSSGVLTASNLSEGGADTPVYFVNGVVTEGNSSLYSLGRSTESNNITIALGRGSSPIHSTISYNLGDNLIGDSATNTITAGYQDAKFSTGLQISEGSVSEDDLYVPVATSSEYGVVKIGYTTSGRNFAVQLSDDKMYVNVPSDNTNDYHTPVYTDGLAIATGGTVLGDINVPIWARTTVGYTPGLVPDPGSVVTNDPRFLSADGQWKIPSNTTYTAGTGLSLSGTEFSITKDSSYDIFHQLTAVDNDATATTYLISQDTSGSKSYYRRPAGKIVNATLVKAALGTGSGTARYFREDGSWITPPYLPIGGGTVAGNLIIDGTLTLNQGLWYNNGTATDIEILKFYTKTNNDGCAVLLQSAGYVGVGAGESATAIYNLLSNDNADNIVNVENLHLSSDSNIYFYTNCNTVANKKTITFNTDGRISAQSFNAESDVRLKENLRPFIHNDIFDLPLYKFDYINGSKNSIGCMAQDLQKICPEIVCENDDGYLTIEESKIVYLLLDKMKEMQKEINELKGV